MTKKFLTLFILVLAGIMAHAQTTSKVALSASTGIDLPSSGGTPGPEFTLKAEVPLVTNLKLTVSAGYLVNSFGRRVYAATPVLYTGTYYNINTPTTPPAEPTGPANSGPYEFIPVKAGLRYYYFKYLYVDAEAGDAFKANVTDNSFIYGGNLGGLASFSKHSALDISVGYSNGYHLQDTNTKIGEVSFRIGYRYQF